MANTYTLISSATVSGTSTTQVNITSIPNTYTDFVLKASVRTSIANTNSGLVYYFNNDTSALYSYTELMGSGSAASSYRNSSTGIDVRYADGNTTAANTFSSLEIYVPNYTSITSKPFSHFNAQENNTTAAYITTTAGLYRNTSALSSIHINTGGAPYFIAGSSFYLYGIKKS